MKATLVFAAVVLLGAFATLGWALTTDRLASVAPEAQHRAPAPAPSPSRPAPIAASRRGVEESLAGFETNSNRGDEERIDALEAQVLALSQSVIALQARLEGTGDGAPASTAVAAPIGSGPVADPEALVRESEQRREDLAHRVSNEPEDDAFASRVEEDLVGGLEGQGIGGASVESSRCSRSTCQLDLVFDGDAAREEALAALPFLLPTRGELSTFADERDPARVVLFASREAANGD